MKDLIELLKELYPLVVEISAAREDDKIKFFELLKIGKQTSKVINEALDIEIDNILNANSEERATLVNHIMSSPYVGDLSEEFVVWVVETMWAAGNLTKVVINK